MNLFAYGTLMDSEIMASVSGARFPGEPATLRDYKRKMLVGEVYPAIAPAEGSAVQGVVYFDLSPRAFARLDQFESSIYQRLRVSADRGTEGLVPANTYVIAPEHVGRLADQDWSGGHLTEGDRARFLRWKPEEEAGSAESAVNGARCVN